jgi:acyl carrier protein
VHPAAAKLVDPITREDLGAQPDHIPPVNEQRPQLRSKYAPPSNEIEEQLVQIWQDLLGIEPIGIHDSIFELGAHSLMAAQLIARLQATFPIEISIRDVMGEGSTVAELAQIVDRLLVERLESLSEEDALLLLQQSDSDMEGIIH